MDLTIVNRSAGTENVVRVGENLATIGDLKAYVEENAQIPCDNQIIVFNTTLITDDGTKVKDLLGSKLMDGELKLYRKIPTQKMTVKVVSETGGDPELNINIESGETVLTLKKMIDKRRCISPHRQRLTIMGAVMKDEDGLDECIVKEGPVYLKELRRNQEETMQIDMVLNYGMVMPMDVEKADTIYTLHGLARQAHISQGRKFYFRWNGERLSGSSTFAEYGITAGSKLKLVFLNSADGDDDDSNGEMDD